LQTIQYILPHENTKLAQAELLVIDEAAAIPLPVVSAAAMKPPSLHASASYI
jgi:tRNA(Met) C34 N-acetyltransferase TmcA